MRLAPRAAILPLGVRTPRTTAPLFSPACACFACQDSHGAHGNAHQEGNPFPGVILASAPHVASGWRKKTTSQQLRRSPAFGRWLPSTTWMPACDRPGIKRLAVLPAAARCARQRRGRGWAASHRRWRLCLGRLVKPSDGRPWSLAKEERPLQGRGINHHHHPQSQPPLLPPSRTSALSLSSTFASSPFDRLDILFFLSSLLVIETARPVPFPPQKCKPPPPP